ncbi:MAG: BCCT family transporter [Butyrivibrio sp.]|nr:BCCT family transporter [Butyrivibrio sp.]
MSTGLVMGVVLICLIAITLFALAPDYISLFVDASFGFMTTKLGIIYILTAVLALGFALVACVKYGKKTIGNGEKEYSELTWAAMMFCTGIGGSMMIFSFLEPIYYLTDPPFDIEPMSVKAYEYAHMYGQFHWGILDWILCVPLSIYVAYAFWATRSNEKLRIGNMLFNRKFLTNLTEVICIFAAIGGAATSMGLAAPIVKKIIIEMLNLRNQGIVLPIVFGIWLIMYGTSVWRGLQKGIRVLSYVNIFFAFVFIMLVLLMANPLRVIKTEINSLGILLTDFFRMTFYTAPFEENGFPQRWTVFYWALTLAYLPGLAAFTARISKGRTISEMVLGMVIYGSLGTMLSFGTLGYYSLYLQKNGIIDVSTILNAQGQETAIFEILRTLPLSSFFEISFALLCMIFMATTIDSTVYVIASMTMNSKMKGIEPPRWLRIFWAVILLLFALGLTAVGGLRTMQTASVITAFPMAILTIVAAIRFWRMIAAKGTE